jgi:tetratricopeptide (TPR) repeat protein
MRFQTVSSVAVALMIAILCHAVLAGQNDPRLPELFDRLAATEERAEAAMVQQRIWEIWSRSEDATVDALMTQGGFAMAQELWPLAISLFGRVTEMAPDFAEGWNKRATVHWLAGDHVASLADIDRTLALEPRHWGALAGLGQIRLAEGDLERSLDAFKRALAVNPHLYSVRALVRELETAARRNRI